MPTISSVAAASAAYDEMYGEVSGRSKAILNMNKVSISMRIDPKDTARALKLIDNSQIVSLEKLASQFDALRAKHPTKAAVLAFSRGLLEEGELREAIEAFVARHTPRGERAAVGVARAVPDVGAAAVLVGGRDRRAVGAEGDGMDGPRVCQPAALQRPAACRQFGPQPPPQIAGVRRHRRSNRRSQLDLFERPSAKRGEAVRTDSEP